MNEAHEKTRIRQLEDAAAHWEHKYANARQYNRNLEERIAALEARCRESEIKPGNWVRLEDHDRSKARIAELEAALREAMEWDWLTDPDSIPKEIYSRLSNMLLMDRFALETFAEVCLACEGQPAYGNIPCAVCGATANRRDE